MKDWARNAMIIILALSVLVGAALLGTALIRMAGPSQTCSRAGGHWIEHRDPNSPVTTDWIKECRG